MHEAVSGALATARTALDDLDRRCCDPGRSPRLAALGTTLTEIEFAAARPEGVTPETATTLLTAAGSMVGALQVGCCAPNRMPLYTTLLTQLNVLQQHLAPMH